MSLYLLPNELLFLIAGYLKNSSLNAFIRTSKYFARILTECLYNDQIQLPAKAHRRLSRRKQTRRFTDCMRLWKSDIILEYFRTMPLGLLNDMRRVPLFHGVIFAKNLTIARILITKGVDIDVRDSRGRTLLLTDEIYFHNEAVLILLIDAGANLMAAVGRRIAFLKCTRRASALIVERIIGKLKNAQTGAAVGRPPSDFIDQMLHQAIASLDMEKVRLLLKHGARISSMYCGVTPLMRAVSKACNPVINLLLDLGADVLQTCDNGITVLSTAEIAACDKSTVKRILMLTIDAGGDISTPGGSVKYWLDDEFSDSDSRISSLSTESMLTPLHKFILHVDLAMVKLLIDNGADVLASLEDESSPLVYAASQLVHYSDFTGLESTEEESNAGSMFGCHARRKDLEEILRELILAARARDDFDGTEHFNDPDGVGSVLGNVSCYGSASLTRLVIESSRGSDGRIGIDVEIEGNMRRAMVRALDRGREDVAEVLFSAMKEQGYDLSNQLYAWGNKTSYLELAQEHGLERLVELFQNEMKLSSGGDPEVERVN
jgi:ankyrin repeat protein